MRYKSGGFTDFIIDVVKAAADSGLKQFADDSVADKAKKAAAAAAAPTGAGAAVSKAVDVAKQAAKDSVKRRTIPVWLWWAVVGYVILSKRR